MTHSNSKEVTRRTDGEKTKAKIIAEAMRLTAEKGYNGTTSKEICEASGVNTALVSYYFGSRKKLHQEVLRCAHDELFSIEEIKKITEQPLSAEQKLREIFGHVYKREKSGKTQQAIRIFLWELRAPTEALAPNIQSTVLPKVAIILQLASDIAGMPIDSPELRKTLFLVLAPCIIAMMFPRLLVSMLFNVSQTNDDKFVDFVWHHALRTLKNAGKVARGETNDIEELERASNDSVSKEKNLADIAVALQSSF